jgi:hypothetical protein
VRSRAEHEIGAGVDRSVRERAPVAAQLAEGLLVVVGGVRALRALGAGVHEDDDDVGVPGGHGHQGASAGQVADRRGRCVGGEAEERDAGARKVDVGDLVAEAGLTDSPAPERQRGQHGAGRTEVEGAVVDGKRVNYNCGRRYLLGGPDRTKPTWRIRQALTPGGIGMRSVAIAAAWR